MTWKTTKIQKKPIRNQKRETTKMCENLSDKGDNKDLKLPTSKGRQTRYDKTY